MANKPTTSWDETSPGGGELLSTADDEMVQIRVQLREVIGSDHVFSSSGQGTDWGFHTVVNLAAQSTPTEVTSVIQVYGKDDADSKCELYFQDEDGDERQVTKGGYLLVVVQNLTSDPAAPVDGQIWLRTDL